MRLPEAEVPRRCAPGGWLLLVALTVIALGSSAVAADLDVHFERASVHEVLRVLAEAEGINVIIDQDVAGEVTMSARGLTAREAMELVAAVRGLHLEQVGNTLVVSTEPKGLSAVEEVPASPGMRFTRRPVGEVIQALSDRAGWNLISEVPLDGEVTAWLDGMDYVEALRLVASAAGLRYQLVDRVLHIKDGRADEVHERVAIHRLDHVDPEKAKELVESFVPGARVDVDTETRSLVARGSAVVLEEVAAFLREFDTARPQVLVEARILEVAVDAMTTLGLEWSDTVAFGGAGTPTAWELTWNPAALQATLRSLAERGRSKVLASPKISAVDGEPARMLIGDRVPIVTEQIDNEGRVFETVEFLEVGIVLEIEPTIASDGYVTLDILTEVSSVSDPTSRFPTVRTREATSRVRVKDGQPLIIGGLIQEEERERMSGIPLLNELPVVGALFGRRVNENVQTETIIVLIPHIVHEGEALGGSPFVPHSDVADDVSAVSGFDDTERMLQALEAPLTTRIEEVRRQVSINFDVLQLVDRAVEVQLEREWEHSGVFARMYGALGADDVAWSIGTGFRLYGGVDGPDSDVRPWFDGAAEYAEPLGDDPVVIFSAGAGLRLAMGEHGLMEMYARHQTPTRAGGLLGLPGRTVSPQFGVKLGWRY